MENTNIHTVVIFCIARQQINQNLPILLRLNNWQLGPRSVEVLDMNLGLKTIWEMCTVLLCGCLTLHSYLYQNGACLTGVHIAWVITPWYSLSRWLCHAISSEYMHWVPQFTGSCPEQQLLPSLPVNWTDRPGYHTDVGIFAWLQKKLHKLNRNDNIVISGGSRISPRGRQFQRRIWKAIIRSIFPINCMKIERIGNMSMAPS